MCPLFPRKRCFIFTKFEYFCHFLRNGTTYLQAESVLGKINYSIRRQCRFHAFICYRRRAVIFEICTCPKCVLSSAHALLATASKRLVRLVRVACRWNAGNITRRLRPFACKSAKFLQTCTKVYTKMYTVHAVQIMTFSCTAPTR